MSNFKPFYDKIEIKPIVKKTIIIPEKESLLEKGEVVSVGDKVKFVKKGDIVYFNSWGCTKTADGHYVLSEVSEVILGKDD